jgi:hypothetical protein
MDTEQEILNHERRINAVEKCQLDLTASVNKLTGSASATLNLIRYVILPLIVVVGGLVGVKIGLEG